MNTDPQANGQKREPKTKPLSVSSGKCYQEGKKKNIMKIKYVLGKE